MWLIYALVTVFEYICMLGTFKKKDWYEFFRTLLITTIFLLPILPLINLVMRLQPNHAGLGVGILLGYLFLSLAGIVIISIWLHKPRPPAK